MRFINRFVFFARYYKDDRNKDAMGRACDSHWRNEYCTHSFVSKTEKRRYLGDIGRNASIILQKL
jgi:hypothetical protein